MPSAGNVAKLPPAAPRGVTTTPTDPGRGRPSGAAPTPGQKSCFCDQRHCAPTQPDLLVVRQVDIGSSSHAADRGRALINDRLAEALGMFRAWTIVEGNARFAAIRAEDGPQCDGESGR